MVSTKSLTVYLLSAHASLVMKSSLLVKYSTYISATFLIVSGHCTELQSMLNTSASLRNVITLMLTGHASCTMMFILESGGGVPRSVVSLYLFILILSCKFLNRKLSRRIHQVLLSSQLFSPATRHRSLYSGTRQPIQSILR
jgi:hypothetical protein